MAEKLDLFLALVPLLLVICGDHTLKLGLFEEDFVSFDLFYDTVEGF